MQIFLKGTVFIHMFAAFIPQAKRLQRAEFGLYVLEVIVARTTIRGNIIPACKTAKRYQSSKVSCLWSEVI